ncbi:MAG: SRPBCC family protein [Thermoleophilia bacterium]
MSTLRVTGSLVVPASPERAWAVWSRVEDWPRWDWMGSAGARWVSGAPWTVGSVLRNGHGPGRFDCLLVRADPPREVSWEGGGFGIRGRHTFRFLPDPGGCRIESSEVFTGIGARSMRPLVRWFWRRQLMAFRRHLVAAGSTPPARPG